MVNRLTVTQLLGATLKMLGMSDCIDWDEVKDFVLTTQSEITGGE